MLTAVRWWRVTTRKPRGPWRETIDEARQDAIALGLGCYDEGGQYYDIVPGGIESHWAVEDQAVA